MKAEKVKAKEERKAKSPPKEKQPKEVKEEVPDLNLKEMLAKVETK